MPRERYAMKWMNNSQRNHIGKGIALCGVLSLLLVLGAAAQDKGQVIEEVVARVNNDAITRGDIERAKAQLTDDVRHDCPTCTPGQISEKVAAQDKNLLRDLIDSSLLVQRAKDMNINVDTQVIKRLDQIRIDNKIASMEDLERQVTATGVDFEDFKNNIRNQLLQQEVIRKEVGSRIVLDHAEVVKYYNEHMQEFVRPEQVVLREIFVSSEGKSETDAAAQRKKAEGLLQRVKGGEDFGELAKRFSDGSTAKQGGDLGTFERGQLAANLEQTVFKMNRNDVTDVMDAKNGYLILQVQEHYPAGQQTEEKVENEIESKIYDQKMQPAMREYLQTLRADSYVEVKAGYVDSAGVPGATIDEVPATPDETDKKKTGHRLVPFSKKKNGV
jgi:peptidyl-prolyl cis-trans isomerase SurA